MVTIPEHHPQITDHLHSRFLQQLRAKWRSNLHGSSKSKTYALVTGAVVLWASWPALATMVYPAPPLLVLGFSALIGCTFSCAMAVRQSALRVFVSVPFGTMAFVAIGLMGNNAFYLAAIARIGPAEANVVHYLWPVFLVLLASMLHRRLPTGVQAFGIACGFGGVVVALFPQVGGRLDGFGVFLGVCGALTFAVYSVVRSFAKVEVDVVGPSLGLAGLSALGAHFMLEPFYWPSTTQWLVLVIMGIGPFTLANLLWDRATRAGTVATISSFAFLTPLVAMGLLAAFGLGNVTAATFAGALLAILGALLSSSSQ